MNQQERIKTAKLLKEIEEEGHKHRWSYQAVLAYYKSIGGEDVEEDLKYE